MESDIGLKIQELVRDPDSNQTNSKPDRHKYYKKPGRGHNRDTCDACGDVGDIVCCDTCPSSFHWHCVNPPLEEDDLPVGGWQCRSCSFLKKKDAESKGTAGVAKMEVDEPEDENASSLEGVILRKDVKAIILELKKQNPQEFKLPAHFTNYEPKLPGLSKPAPKKSLLKNKNVIVEPDSNSKKRIIALCYACDRSSRIGPLIACDFCQTQYHLDCLDPPLTVAPSGLWNCPLHPEPMMETKYLNSSKLSERAAIWDQTSTPLRPMTVTLNFMSKAHRSGPTKQSSTNFELKPFTNVPGFLVDAYNGFRAKNTESIELDQPGTNSNVVNPPIPIPNVVEGVNQPANSNSVQHGPKLAQRTQQAVNGLDLLAQASEFLESNENVADRILKGLSIHTVKELAAKKLMEDPLALKRLRSSIERLPLHTEQKTNSSNNPIPQPQSKPYISFVSLNNGIKLTCNSTSCDVGTGPNVRINLSLFGARCERASSRHAYLFYDRVKCRWELINYGEHGTLVNNCLYGCDVSVYANQNNQNDETLTIRRFKEIVDERRNALTMHCRLDGDEEDYSIVKEKYKCLCPTTWDVVPKNCWEGSAIIKSGDVIQIGCIKLMVHQGSS